MQSHVDEFRKQEVKNDDGSTAWQTIELMSQGAKTYSRTTEPLSFIQEMTARVSAVFTAQLRPFLALLPFSNLQHSEC